MQTNAKNTLSRQRNFSEIHHISRKFKEFLRQNKAEISTAMFNLDFDICTYLVYFHAITQTFLDRENVIIVVKDRSIHSFQYAYSFP